MNAETRRAADERRVPNVEAANALERKLRTTDEPLTNAERLTLASLLATLSNLVAAQPRDTFDKLHTWASVASAFDVRMSILRGDHDDTGGVL